MILKFALNILPGLLLLCCANVGAADRASSAAPNASAYGALQWRGIGPFRGGRAVAVAGVPGSPDVFYFGAAAGGVWKTVDAGATWKPIFDAVHAYSIGAMAVAPSNPNMNGSEANLAFPGMLNEQLAAFAGTLEDADTLPTAQQRALYTSLHEKLQAQLTLLRALDKK